MRRRRGQPPVVAVAGQVTDQHPSVELDDVVHQRVRLGLLALLRPAAAMEFTLLRDILHLTDGNLNRHLAVLRDAGLVEVEKRSGVGARRTWVAISDAGRTALDAELALLRRLVDTADGDGGATRA